MNRVEEAASFHAFGGINSGIRMAVDSCLSRVTKNIDEQTNKHGDNLDQHSPLARNSGV